MPRAPYHFPLSAHFSELYVWPHTQQKYEHRPDKLAKLSQELMPTLHHPFTQRCDLVNVLKTD